MNDRIQTRRARRIPALMKQLALATTLLLGAAGGASASLVTYNFSGGSGADAVTGYFSFYTDTPDTNVDPHVGVYDAGSTFPIGFGISNAQVGGVSGWWTTGDVVVANDSNGEDAFQLLLSGSISFIINLSDTTQTALSSDALPTGMNLDQFTSGTVYARDFTGRVLADNLQLTSLVNAAAVPEPSSVALALAGLGALVGTVRLRRRPLRDGRRSSV